jgi:hypothetical protein
MVILGFSDGHIEQHPELSAMDLAQLDQPINLLTPEEIELLEDNGVFLDVGYLDPRREVQ